MFLNTDTYYKLELQEIIFSPLSHCYSYWEQPETLKRAEILSRELDSDLRIDFQFFLKTTNSHHEFSVD